MTLFLRTTQSTALCPLCATTQTRVHSRYTRTLADLPCVGFSLRWRILVRRFFCNNSECKRAIFTEHLGALAGSYARRTTRLLNNLQQLGFSLGGQAGARLALSLKLPTSATTLLRLVKQAALPAYPTPRVLGVDDFAFRKAQSYGTVLIDLEQHRVVDLLEDREAATFAKWLQDHPGVEIISRDRASAYAQGARLAAPQAIQVADRFHLTMNLRAALKRLVERYYLKLKPFLHSTSNLEIEGDTGAGTFDNFQQALGEEHKPALVGAEANKGESLEKEEELSSELEILPAPVPFSWPSLKQHRELKRSLGLARYEQILELRNQGLGIKKIAQKLGINHLTVRRLVTAPAFPERQPRGKQPSKLDPYLPYLAKRWQAGCHNGRELWRELQGQGYQGSAVGVNRYIKSWRDQLNAKQPIVPAKVKAKAEYTPPKAVSVPKERVISASQVSWWMISAPEKLSSENQAKLKSLREGFAEVELAYQLGQDFLRMLRKRPNRELEEWLERSLASGLEDLVNFGQGIANDKAAVQAAMELEWNNGPTEGSVNRLKLVKRQMYGRAKFGLLKARVIGTNLPQEEVRRKSLKTLKLAA